MKKTDKKVREDCKKNKTWELFYPDGTSSLMNYNPIIEERKETIKEVVKVIEKEIIVISDIRKTIPEKFRNVESTLKNQEMRLIASMAILKGLKQKITGDKK